MRKKHENNEQQTNKELNHECCCGEECQCENGETRKECHCQDTCTCTNDDNQEDVGNHECCCDEECECDEECHCHEKCTCEEEHNQAQQLTLKINELQDALLRNKAELQNYRKRKDEETARIIKYAEEDILKGFLPILDNFERAISMDNNNFGDETSKFLEGFRMVYTQTKNLLEKFEVKEIDCLGQEFDPTYEQAITTVKREDKKSGIVTEVYQKGYMYKDKVLRTAMVIVSE